MNLSDTLALTGAAAAEHSAIVLVEGESDQMALYSLAQRLGLDLDARRTAVVAMGGVTNIGHFVDLLAPIRQEIAVAGLYDAGEERQVRRALERAGFGSHLARSDLQSLGFFVCQADLEDELIRSAGVSAVLEVAAQQGELAAFRTFQAQPNWRGRSAEAQLRRWIGAGARRKLRYATLLANELDLTHLPAPLDGLLTYLARVS